MALLEIKPRGSDENVDLTPFCRFLACCQKPSLEKNFAFELLPHWDLCDLFSRVSSNIRLKMKSSTFLCPPPPHPPPTLKDLLEPKLYCVLPRLLPTILNFLTLKEIQRTTRSDTLTFFSWLQLTIEEKLSMGLFSSSSISFNDNAIVRNFYPKKFHSSKHFQRFAANLKWICVWFSLTIRTALDL